MLESWLIAEFIFYFYYRFTKRRLEQRIYLRKPLPGASKEVLERCLNAMIDSGSSEEDIQQRKRQAVMGWFRSGSSSSTTSSALNLSATSPTENEKDDLNICKDNVR